MSIEKNSLVPVEFCMNDGDIVMRFEDASVVLDESSVTSRPRPLGGVAEVAIGRALYVDKPVIPQGYRKGLVEPS